MASAAPHFLNTILERSVQVKQCRTSWFRDRKVSELLLALRKQKITQEDQSGSTALVFTQSLLYGASCYQKLSENLGLRSVSMDTDNICNCITGAKIQIVLKILTYL